MQDYRIIPMASSHCKEIARMESECFSTPWSEESIRLELENPLSLWLVAIRDDVLIGYIGSQTVMNETDMLNIAVLPEMRGCGIGHALVKALIDALKKKQSQKLFLEVRETNHTAISLYESFGFEKVGLRRNYYVKPKENAVIYRKDIS